MSDKSKIEWTDATWNPTTGCHKQSQGCKNCYAERTWDRLSKMPDTVYFGRKFTDVQTHSERLDTPKRWRQPRRIFVNSMSDLFDPMVPDSFIDQVFETIAQCPQHTFQILTKQAARMQRFLTQAHSEIPRRSIGYSARWTNLQLGVSVEDQATADERIPLLLLTPASIRFISVEPMLGAISFEGMFASSQINDGTNALEALDWVIAGGESGPKARPAHPDWFRSLRDQCAAAEVPFFFKQWGEWKPDPDEQHPQRMFGYHDGNTDIPDYRTAMYEADGETAMAQVGKKKAGRLLDGVEHNGRPKGCA